MTGRDRALSAALVLGAFALRTWDVAGQSLWSDEDITLDRSALSLGALWRELPVEHGALYFALMRGWTRLAGDGDLALRLPSVLAGTVVVALALALGRRMVGARGAWFAAAAAAVSPFLTSYSQEARMYALLAAIGLGALAAAERAGPRRRWTWPAAGALAALATHTHLFGALLIPILAVLAAGDVLGRWSPSGRVAENRAARRATARGWLLAAATAAALVSPIAPRLAALAGAGDALAGREWLVEGAEAGAAGTAAAAPAAAGRLIAAWAAQTVVTAGRPPSTSERLATALLAAAAAVGALALARAAARRDRAGRRAALALAWVAAPLLAGTALAVLGVAIHPRYLILGAPALLLAAGAGIARLPSRAALAAGAGVVAVVALPLADWFGDPAARKRDYRALVAQVDVTTHGRDSVLLLDGPSMGLAKRYLPPDSPLKLENLRSETNAGRDAAGFDARLQELARRRPNVWLATDGAASTDARDWLAAHLHAMGSTGVQDVTLRRYASAADGRVPLPVAIGCVAPPPMGWSDADDTTFGASSPTSVLCLRAAVAAPDPASPGDVVRIALRWLPGERWPTSAAAAREHRVSVRLVAAGRAVASLDGRPVDWTRPTTGWRPGETIDDRYALVVPLDVGAGPIAVEATLYDEATLEPFVPLVRLAEDLAADAASPAP